LKNRNNNLKSQVFGDDINSEIARWMQGNDGGIQLLKRDDEFEWDSLNEKDNDNTKFSFVNLLHSQKNNPHNNNKVFDVINPSSETSFRQDVITPRSLGIPSPRERTPDEFHTNYSGYALSDDTVKSDRTIDIYRMSVKRGERVQSTNLATNSLFPLYVPESVRVPSPPKQEAAQGDSDFHINYSGYEVNDLLKSDVRISDAYRLSVKRMDGSLTNRPSNINFTQQGVTSSSAESGVSPDSFHMNYSGYEVKEMLDSERQITEAYRRSVKRDS
jgi:hypothetical protein